MGPQFPRYPMLLEPRLVEKPWGGSSLARLFGKRAPSADARVGESWEVYDRPWGASAIRNGPRTLIAFSIAAPPSLGFRPSEIIRRARP